MHVIVVIVDHFSREYIQMTEAVFYIMLFAGLILAAAAVAAVFRYYGKSRYLKRFDEMDGRDFEYYCAQLLERHGFCEVEVTKGSGDYGVDILAEKEGITYAIQCKCYNNPVGVKAVQEAYAGRDYYDRMVGCVLTNRRGAQIKDTALGRRLS